MDVPALTLCADGSSEEGEGAMRRVALLDAAPLPVLARVEEEVVRVCRDAVNAVESRVPVPWV